MMTRSESTAASRARRSAESSFTTGSLRQRKPGHRLVPRSQVRVWAPGHNRQEKMAGSAAGAAGPATHRDARRAARSRGKHNASRRGRTCTPKALAARGSPDRRAAEPKTARRWYPAPAARRYALLHDAPQQAKQLCLKRSKLRPRHRTAWVNDDIPS